MTLTPAQLRALEWLPADGEWRTVPAYMDDKELDEALGSLWLCEPAYIDFEPCRGDGNPAWQFCLTPAGQALRAQMEKNNG